MKYLISVILAIPLLFGKQQFSPPTCSIVGGPKWFYIQLPATTYTLTGTAAGTGGASIASVKWTCVTDVTSGGVSLTSSTSLTTGVTGMTLPGNYVFKLVVTDNNGLQDSTWISINNLPQNNTGPFHRYNLTASGGGLFFPNTRTQPWKGGDTLVLPRGFLTSDIIFGGVGTVEGGNNLDFFSGDPGHPIIIMGPDVGVDSSNIIRMDDHCQYFKFISNPANPNPFSIWTEAIGTGLINNAEFAWIIVDGSLAAGSGNTDIICKKHIDTLVNGHIVDESIYPNYWMVNITYTHMIVRKSDHEGGYIGSTAPYGGDGQGPAGFYPTRLDSVTFSYITWDSLGWTGLQVSSCLHLWLHDMKMTNYGWRNASSHQAGFILGAGATGFIYNDTASNGTGNNFEIFGYGLISMYNNIADSGGRDGTGSGQALVFIDDRPSTVDPNAPQNAVATQTVAMYNNYFKHPQTFGAIRIQNDGGTEQVDTIRSNNFCIPGETSGTYYAHFVFTSPTAVNFGNALCTNCSLVPPTVSAGSNQSIGATSSTLTGTATGNSGATISSTLWSKKTSNAATITSPSSLSTTVTGLLSGSYIFELSAVDNNGLVGVSDINVNVNLPSGCNCIQSPFKVIHP